MKNFSSIKKNKDFIRVYENKKSFATKNLVMYVLKNSDMERNRIGISVSHKVGNSVIRHTLTRKMREIFRKNEKNFFGKQDMIIVFRMGAKEAEFFKLNEEFIYLCKRHGIIKEKETD